MYFSDKEINESKPTAPKYSQSVDMVMIYIVAISVVLLLMLPSLWYIL